MEDRTFGLGQPQESLTPGTPVELFVDYTGEWVPGYEVADGDASGCFVRRHSDGRVLPHRFTPSEVRLK